MNNQIRWFNDENTAAGQLKLGNRTYQIDRLPHDVAVEKALIIQLINAGDIGNTADAMQRVGSILKPQDFYQRRLGLVYEMVSRLVSEGKEADYISLKSAMEHTPTSDKQTLWEYVNGETLMADVLSVGADSSPSALHSYAVTIAEHAVRREIIADSYLIADNAHDKPLEELVGDIQRRMSLTGSRALNMTDRSSGSLNELLSEQEESLREDLATGEVIKRGIPTGFPTLDRITRGWVPGRLYLISAPPGWGKSAAVLRWAQTAMEQGKRVLFISLEMSREDMVNRMIAMEARVDANALVERNLERNEQTRVFRALESLRQIEASKTFTMAHMTQPTMAALRALIQRYALDPGFDVLFIDYVGAETITGSSQTMGGLEVSGEIYRELKALKEDFNKPIIAAAQMNKDWQHRSAKKPQQEDIYYGGVAKNVADAIMFLYHPHKVDELLPKDVVSLLVRKNRHGAAAELEFYWDERYTLLSPKPINQS